MVKTPEELSLLRTSGRLLARVFELLDNQRLEGKTTMDINNLVDTFITQSLNARPASKGQYGYEYSLHCSINNVVCHGVPSSDEVIRDGDIINFDITLEKNGFIADSSKTYVIGNASPAAKRIVRIANSAMWQGIKQVRAGAHIGDIGFAIERFAKSQGCSVVREYCGHGIGQKMHEEPQILNFGRPKTGMRLREGMVFTVEPMVNQGTRRVETQSDGWTVSTKDKKLSAQFEHTIAVTKHGAEILTLRQGERTI